MIACFILLSFYAYPAYAFSTIMFFDPDFIEFLLIEMPLISAMIMSIFELSYLILRYGINRKFIGSYICINFFSMIFNILLMTGILFVIGDTLATSHQSIIYFGIVYFGSVFIHMGFISKYKIAKQFIEESHTLKKEVFCMNTISYICLYIFLYFRL